jgi:hypothetical protein
MPEVPWTANRPDPRVGAREAFSSLQRRVGAPIVDEADPPCEVEPLGGPPNFPSRNARRLILGSFGKAR